MARSLPASSPSRTQTATSSRCWNATAGIARGAAIEKQYAERWNHLSAESCSLFKKLERDYWIRPPNRYQAARPTAIAAAFRTKTGIGGAGGTRTRDLYNAIVALSQLSYGPIRQATARKAWRALGIARLPSGSEPKKRWPG